MSKNSVILLLLFVAVIFVSGCNGNDKPFTPSIDFKLDKSSVSVNDNTVTSHFVKSTFKRLDNEDIPTIFIMKFVSDKPGDIYVVDSEGNKIDELSTRPLKGKDDEDIRTFKVFGMKRGYTKAESQIKIELWWNNTKLEGMDRTLEVIVK